MKSLIVFVGLALVAAGCGKTSSLTGTEQQEWKEVPRSSGYYYSHQNKGHGPHYSGTQYVPGYYNQGYYNQGYYYPGYSYPGYYVPAKKHVESGNGWVRNPGYDAAPPWVRHNIPQWIPAKKQKAVEEDGEWHEDGWQGQGAGAGEGASNSSIGDHYRRKYRGW